MAVGMCRARVTTRRPEREAKQKKHQPQTEEHADAPDERHAHRVAHQKLPGPAGVGHQLHAVDNDRRGWGINNLDSIAVGVQSRDGPNHDEMAMSRSLEESKSRLTRRPFPFLNGDAPASTAERTRRALS